MAWEIGAPSGHRGSRHSCVSDRYVLTGEQPAPHAAARDAIGSVDLVQRYGAMAAGIGWTRGVLDQAGSLAVLEDNGDALSVELRSVSFEVEAVTNDLHRRRHPNADFISSILTGQRPQIRHRSNP